MPRIARVVVPGYRHYVRQVAVHGTELFSDEVEASIFGEKLQELAIIGGCEVHAITIWGHRVDIVMTAAKRNSLARTVGEASRQFSRYVATNKAPFTPKRFLSCPVDKSHAQAALRIMNVDLEATWPAVRGDILFCWSDPNNHKDLSRKDNLLGTGGQLDLALERAEAEMRLGVAVRTGRPAGDRAFIRRVERLLNRQFRVGRRGRPVAPFQFSGIINPGSSM
jgi:REP-associated tyrosine transposase